MRVGSSGVEAEPNVEICKEEIKFPYFQSIRVGSSGVEAEPNPEGTDKPSSEVGEEKPAEVNVPNIPKK